MLKCQCIHEYRMMLTRADQIAGCLFGGALGDAIGAHYETTGPSGTFRLPVDLRITDDTQLTIATCESIVELGAVNAEGIAGRFVRWFRERRFTGLGSSTLKSLSELDAGGHWALVGATGERAAGNGAAIRIAPLAFFLDPDRDVDRQQIRDVCRITHRNDEAYLGALAIVRALRFGMASGRIDATVFSLLIESLPDSRVRDRLSETRESALTVRQYAERFGSSGYVVDSVPLAILAAVESSRLLKTIEQLAVLGGDVDSIASLCGQLLGASQGLQSLPTLVDQINAVDLLRSVALELSRVPVALQR